MTTLAIFSILILVMSVTIHEFAHGIAALWQGDPTAKLAGRLTMNPIKHLDLVGSFIIPLICVLLPGGLVLGWAKPVPVNPYNFRNRRFGEAIVSFAGPLSNIIIALILGLFLRFQAYNLNENMIQLLIVAVLTNIVLAVFNLVPLPPLDGSKILYSIFPDSMGRFIQTIEKYGLILTFIFIFAFIQVLNPIIQLIFNLIVGG